MLLSTRRRAFATTAVVLSLVLHAGLLYLFTGLHVGALAIPAEKRRLLPPLHLKRVEIPPPAADQAPPAPIPPPSTTQDALPARLPESLQPTPGLPGAPPPAEIPSGPPGAPASFVPIVPAPPGTVSPYALDDKAAISAAIAKSEIGPVTAGLPAPSASLPASPGATPVTGTDPAGQRGTSALPSASALPSLSQVTAQFRLPPPSLNPNLPQPVVLNLPTDILFDFDSAQLRAGAEGVLGQALDYIRKYPRADVEIDGHTDSFGKADYNRKLSLDRAQAVREWFRGKLAEADFSITAKGFGSSRPVVPTSGTVAQQQKNRRVEIVLRAIAPSGP